jgi:hypothetical protein
LKRRFETPEDRGVVLESVNVEPQADMEIRVVIANKETVIDPLLLVQFPEEWPYGVYQNLVGSFDARVYFEV